MIGFNKDWSNTPKEGMLGVIFDKQVNRYAEGGIVEVPFPYNSYLVTTKSKDGQRTSGYNINISFKKEFKVYKGEISVESKEKSPEERIQKVTVVNGEEIKYEYVENEYA